MLASLRRQLRRIRYYSAAREQTPWTRSADRIFFAAFALALPAAFLANIVITRPFVVEARAGMFLRERGGETSAALIEGDHPTGGWPSAAFGRFNVAAVEEHRGWPFVTSTLSPTARLDLRLFHEQESRLDTGRDDDAPLREAVGRTLAAHGSDALAQAWQRRSPHVESRSILRWLFASIAWWIMLYVAGMASLSAARLGVFLHERLERARIEKWKRRGRCLNCGYDLRGTEFSERCPECGELA